MLSQIFATLVQIAVLCLIPFLVFLIRKRSTRGFLEYIGLKRSNPRANLIAVLGSLLLALPLIVLAFVNTEFKEITTAPGTVIGNLKGSGSTTYVLFLIFMIAIFKTSLSEEIFFRGFVAKRLIAMLGYPVGNSAQAALFGILHFVIFLQITSSVLYLTVILIFPAMAAFLMGYLNERIAEGSIIPGWIAHGLGNLVSYGILVFLT